MNHSSVKHCTLMFNNKTSYNNMNHSSVKPQTVMDNNIKATTTGTTPLSNMKP